MTHPNPDDLSFLSRLMADDSMLELIREASDRFAREIDGPAIAELVGRFDSPGKILSEPK